MDKKYIDQEALIRTIFPMGTQGDLNYTLNAKAVKIAIEKQKAADVAPVVHGEWLPTNDKNKKRCSRCDVIHLIAQYPHGDANYCPYCGAINMDGGKK